MSVISFLLIGGIVGWFADEILGRDEGVAASLVIGIVGSIVGGNLSWLVTGSDRAYLAFSWVGLFWSFIGALLLITFINAVQHNPRRHIGV